MSTLIVATKNTVKPLYVYHAAPKIEPNSIAIKTEFAGSKQSISGQSVDELEAVAYRSMN